VLASPAPNPEERIVLQIKIDRLRGVTPPGPPLGLAAGPLHSGLSFGLVPFNGPDARVSASDLCLLLESKWLLPCALLPPIQVDDTQILDTRRRQYGGDRILEELGRRYPADRRPHPFIIAVTGRDIFAPETNFVFSWQSPSTGLGVMSTHRFMAGLDDFYEPGVVATRRVAIQLLSTSGSLLGFTRPTQPECPLAYPHGVREFMLKGSRLCDSTVAEREALLKRRGGPSAPWGAAKAEEIGRLYRTYHFD
jgi:predicted Zn-dependent protease